MYTEKGVMYMRKSSRNKRLKKDSISVEQKPLHYQDLMALTETTEEEFYGDVFLMQNTSSVRPVMGGISIRSPEEFALFNMPHVKFATRLFMYKGLGDELDVNL